MAAERAGLATEGSWVRILVEPLRNFGNSVYPALPVSFGGENKSLGLFYLVFMPEEGKAPTKGVNV